MKKTRTFGIVSLGVCVSLMLSMVCGCGSSSETSSNSNTANRQTHKAVDQSLLPGIAEPETLKFTYSKKSIDIATLLQSMGVKSYLNWVNISDTMLSESEVNQDVINRHDGFYTDVGYSGVKRMVAVSRDWLMPEELKNTYSGFSIPERDMTDGSDYRVFLASFQTQWSILVKHLSSIRCWQVGFEWNLDEYLHPLGYEEDKSKVFTAEEKAAIITDLMYAASQGIHFTDKYATVVMTALAPTGDFDGVSTAAFLEMIYRNIESGEFGNGSTNPDDYFQVLAWNPIISDAPDDAWAEDIQEVYRVAQNHGDDGKAVFLSKFGYADNDDEAAATQQGEWIAKAYALVQQKLPFVETLFSYRCFRDTGAEASQRTMGLFTDVTMGLAPTAKAYAVQRAWGGNGELDEFVPSDEDYASGDNLAIDAYVEASSSCQHWDWGWNLPNIQDGIITGPSGWITWYEGDHPFRMEGKDGNGAPTADHNEWLLFTLPVTTTINQVNLFPRYLTDYHGYNFPREFQILTSEDGTTWYEVGSYAPETFGKNIYSYHFGAIKAKYVKINFTRMPYDEGTESYHVALSEVEIIKA